ncbi:hypothetical protein M2451_003044 [Dysgonomonas sp. PFB1-18]|uniref:hypothetical protein n=1 Tax=unclassified Dysgonomonas TaxID=2630389 RepID=UPI00247469B2|nr:MULTISPECIES: hypothetical protein [unclassified Dysgonomonas]MDH6310152.1 hypothetical protein [Dysgonomonas sp. PF1-14]MDH6340182.1 hypothetical protein [Dysgonomonas sp. PF1-16]MDH6381709.1 hypothetical protein [Dysgonomonas sp. PFB1-18]MDH6399068.1 hypothetical protein [Dysgonomonas sp. PF1-23]
MKVYARYFEENGLGFRRDTILQFGDSWDLIGSIILINPGSAAPRDTPKPDVLKKLLAFNSVNPESWKEFSVDPTMGQIEKLFNGQFIEQSKPLNGVIQLFNLFNLRNENLSKALEAFERLKTTSNPNITSLKEDIAKIGKMPVYFGWGSTGKGQLKHIAKKAFEGLSKQPYLNDNFDDNFFYHPRYLQMRYKTNRNVIKILHDFYNQDKKWDGITTGTNTNPSKEENEKTVELCVKELEKEWAYHQKKNNRFVIANEQLSLTVTHTGGGYIAIRHLNKEIKTAEKKPEIDGILKKYNFPPYINDKGNLIWLGTKKLSSFKGSNPKEISENIISELAVMISELESIYS